jgi:hypothetical protein
LENLFATRRFLSRGQGADYEKGKQHAPESQSRPGGRKGGRRGWSAFHS